MYLKDVDLPARDSVSRWTDASGNGCDLYSCSNISPDTLARSGPAVNLMMIRGVFFSNVQLRLIQGRQHLWHGSCPAPNIIGVCGRFELAAMLPPQIYKEADNGHCKHQHSADCQKWHEEAMALEH